MKIKSFKPKFIQNTQAPQRGQFNVAVPQANVSVPQRAVSGHDVVRIISLGGVGNVQRNMFVYEYRDDIIIIDCGVSFPEEDMPGVDLVIPDISYLKDKKSKIRGILISHGHDDHIGGLPYIWPELDVPIYTQKLTAGFIKSKFDEHKLPKDKIHALTIDDKVKLGAFEASFYAVTHSVPDSTGIVLRTPIGTLIHQSDFKIDWTPVSGSVPDVGRIAQVGNEGVLFMSIDSLRVEKKGYTLSERAIEQTFKEFEETTKGKLMITTTSSNITRIQQAVNVAAKSGRKLALSGRSVESNFQVARDLGYLDVPAGLVIAQDEVKRFPDEKLMIIIAGSQGQPGSALSRVANFDHKYIQAKKDDTVIFSADPIPGSEVDQYALIDKLTQIGCRVYYSAMDSDLHVSVLPNTEVLVRDQEGRVKLEEIQNVDDNLEAYSFDRKYCMSSWRKAKKIEHNYSGQVYKITTKSGRSVEVTRGHSLFALQNCQINEIKSENLEIGDCLVIPKSLPDLELSQTIDFRTWMPKQKGYSQRDGFIYYCNVCIGPTELNVDQDFCRLLGYYLAEGSAPRHLSIVLNTQEQDLADEIKGLVSKLFKCSLRTEVRGNAQEITFGTPFLGKVFKGWFGQNATIKKIPDFTLRASEQAKLAFLGAYINGDGGIDKGNRHARIRIKTSSKKLASDLLYLFSSVGIIARFDHIQHNPSRMVGKYELRPTLSYVIRIQDKSYIQKLLPYLSEKFQTFFASYINSKNRRQNAQVFAPEALPIKELNLLDETHPKPNTTLAAIYNTLAKRSQLPQNFINRQIIERDAQIIGNPLIYYLSGDLLFDPIKKIEVSEYEGVVYDLSVPGPENFLGGFGGIFLHNSGHASQEEIKLMVNLAKPKYILPIGGTFRNIRGFQDMAVGLGYKPDQIMMTRDGDVIELGRNFYRIENSVNISNVYVDGLGVGDVGSIVLRDRQLMSEEGIVMVIVPLDIQHNRLVGSPEMISRGFVFEKASEELLEFGLEIVKNLIAEHTKPGSQAWDWKYLRAQIETNLEKFFYQETNRRPLILPVVVNL